MCDLRREKATPDCRMPADSTLSPRGGVTPRSRRGVGLTGDDARGMRLARLVPACPDGPVMPVVPLAAADAAGIQMTHLSWRRALCLAAAILGLAGADAGAQYFGRNKVQYERFDFRIMRSDHLDHYFYPAESLATADMARAGERWYTRLSGLFRHQFDRKAIVWYADHPDFQQTNVAGGGFSEGTGGVTEGFRTRVVMPFTGSYHETHHVLGHELVHVFQYNIAEAGPGGLGRLMALPLWMVEGMAEYLSIGRHDPLTAMWLRDAALRDKLPTIKQLNTDPRFFPYRYGQALWAYVGGRWGDRAVVDVYRTALRVGWEDSFIRVLGMSSDSLSKDWIAATKAAYTPLMADRTRPVDMGTPVLGTSEKTGEYNLAPTVSPDGRHVAFFSRRELFTIDLFVADAVTGRVIKRLAGPNASSHFDAISFIQSAGTWSPDGKKFAFIALAEGDHEIAILDVESTDIERRIQIPSVGAVHQLSWSPDGQRIAFSGMSGGISDLYLLDVGAGTVRALTSDRYADVMPAWSPDGRTIAFATDRGSATSFDQMVFGDLKLATYDVDDARLTILSPFARGKHINPQYSPDGRALFFISDQDGFADIYRLELATNALSRVTHVATGVSGITTNAPAMSVSRQTGRMLFSVFHEQGFSVYGLDADSTVGRPVPADAPVVAAAILPPGDPPGRAVITSYLRDWSTGLPSKDVAFEQLPYRPRFNLDAISQPTVGAGTSAFGTQVSGGVSLLFGDQLSDQQIFAAVQAQGQIQDIGGSVTYLNMKNRVNWGASAAHIPYLTGYVMVSEAEQDGLFYYDQILQRIFVDQGALLAQYPFSTTRRLEANLSATHLGFNVQRQRLLVTQNDQVLDSETSDLDSGMKPVFYSQGALAWVGDNSFSAFVGPVSGSRFRLEGATTVGSVHFNSVTADYRKYFFMRPFTFAVRGLHFGQYGRDAEQFDFLLQPLFLGEPTLVRGYAIPSFEPDDCGGNLELSCPAFARLVGSRIAVFNAEFRIPLFGTSQYGLINFPYLPLEVAPFVDAGVAWWSEQSPRFAFEREARESPGTCEGENNFLRCVERVPVVSTGLSLRTNVLGYFVLEAFIAHPFQRPARDWVWGIQLAPGF
jgi:hypothetical protein